jgi:hypothetical protein
MGLHGLEQGYFYLFTFTMPWRHMEKWRHNPAFLTSIIDGGEWTASHSRRFTPRKDPPWYSLDKRLGWRQNRSGSHAVRMNIIFINSINWLFFITQLQSQRPESSQGISFSGTLYRTSNVSEELLPPSSRSRSKLSQRWLLVTSFRWLHLLFYPEDWGPTYLRKFDKLTPDLKKYYARRQYTYLLMYGAEPFLRSCQLCSHSGNSQQFLKEPEGSSPCSQEPSTGPYPEPVRFSPHHPILSL